MSVRDKRLLVTPGEGELSISDQCNILGLPRSSYYYAPARESALNLELMEKIDKHYMDHPYKGAPRMYVYLTQDLGYTVSRNRVDRLYYDVMGLRAVFPGPHTSKRRKDHKVYPYLLRGLEIQRPNQVWATDITYIPMPQGYMYLVAIIDLYSRYVVHWSLSNTMLASWCVQTYLEAVAEYGVPDILNTDQGSQFTAEEFARAVLGSGARLSMDGKGRATDNAFIESLWKLVKYEHVYIFAHDTAHELYNGLNSYFVHYNTSRRHSSLDHGYPIAFYGSILNV